jgi:hypothetical protein
MVQNRNDLGQVLHRCHPSNIYVPFDEDILMIREYPELLPQPIQKGMEFWDSMVLCEIPFAEKQIIICVNLMEAGK